MSTIHVEYDADPDNPELIENYMHCVSCFQEMPPGEIPQTWARVNVGILPDGRLQVWCVRHKCNICIISFSIQQTH